jgi:hypothetical protein
MLIMVLPDPHIDHKHIVINQQMYGRHIPLSTFNCEDVTQNLVNV